MAAGSDVVFSGNLMDPEAWDDTALVVAYERAITSFRSVEDDSIAADGGAASAVDDDWHVGDACAARWDVDGEVRTFADVYEAEITGMDRTEGRCTVLFISYGNSASVRISDLLPAGSGVDAGGVVGDVDEEMQDATVDRLARDAQAAPAFSAGADSLHWRVGDQCHCTYVADGQEYEAEIDSITRDRSRCTVFFPAYGNRQYGTPLAELKPSSLPKPTPGAGVSAPTPGAEDALANMTMAWYTSGYHTGYYQALRDAGRM